MPKISNLFDQTVEQFFHELSPYRAGYKNISITYLAIWQNDIWNIIHARIYMHPMPIPVKNGSFTSENVRAGHHTLEELRFTCEQIISKIKSGEPIPTPSGSIMFPCGEGENIDAYFSRFHPDGLISARKIIMLRLSGARLHNLINTTEIDWELRAADQPYTSLQELLVEYMLLDSSNSDFAKFEIIGVPVIEIGDIICVNGDKAEPTLVMAKSLDKNLAKMGVKILVNGNVQKRFSVQGSALSWTEDEHRAIGKVLIDVPKGAFLHCSASYEGRAQHTFWLHDPQNNPNPRREVVLSCDENLEILRDILLEEQRPRKESREFEDGVATLFWMLGFSPIQIGRPQRMSNSPDIIATNKRGDIIVVECTTGLLNKEGKLGNLLARANEIRRRLDASGHSGIRILPVIVTPKVLEDVRGEISQAHAIGISVATRDDIIAALDQARFNPNPDSYFDEAWNALHPQTSLLDMSVPSN